MPAPLTDEWIERQLEVCAKATPGPWLAYSRDCSGKLDSAYWSGLGWEIDKLVLDLPNRGQFGRGEDALFIAAAREGYSATLSGLQVARGELRIVYAILQGLYLSIDNMTSEKIKEAIGHLVNAGADWLGKEATGASSD